MSHTRVDRILAELGSLIEHVGATADGPPDLSRYRVPGGREAFVRDMLRAPALLGWQVEAWHALTTYDLLAVRSANSCGKTAWNLMSALYECYVNEAVVLYGSATWRQNRQQGARELKKMLARAPALAGDVFTYGLVPGWGAGVVHFIAGDDASALQGYHDRRVVVILDEFQGSDDELLEAAFANISGGDSVLIVTGNPLQYGTAFHALFQKNSPGWWKRKVDAYEVLADPTYALIPGLVTQKWVTQMQWEWGEESAKFGSRIKAEFPRTPDDAMFPPEAIAAAFARHADPAFISRTNRLRLSVGLDVGASNDGDESVLVSAKGGWVRELVTWRERDTMKSVGRVVEELRRLSVVRVPNLSAQNRLARSGELGFALVMHQPGDPLRFGGVPATIRVDEIGCGKGVADRLAEQGYDVEPFNASRRPDDGTVNDRGEQASERYQNRRAEAADRFRTMLINGEVALPYDRLLEEELRTCRAFTNSSGKLQVISKKDWREVLGRSPDRLDAVIMAVVGDTAVGFDTVSAFAEFAF